MTYSSGMITFVEFKAKQANLQGVDKCSLFFCRFSVNYSIVNLLLFCKFQDCCFKQSATFLYCFD